MRPPSLLNFFGLALAVGVAAQATGGASFAQAPPPDFVVEQFDPLPNQGTNILNIGKSDVIPHLKPSVGVMFHFQDNPLQLFSRNDPTQTPRNVVDYVLKGEVWASIGLFDFVDVSIIMPIVLSQKAGEILTLGGQDFASFTAADLRFIPKIRLLDPEDTGGFGLAVIAPISFPTGDSGSYNSEGNVRIEPRLVADFQYEGFTVAANLAYQPRPRRTLLNSENTDALRWGVGLEIPVIEDTISIIGSFFGAVAVGGDSSGAQAKNMPIEVLGGVQAYFAEDFVVNAGAGRGLTDGIGATDFRIFASIGYVPRRKIDRDRDRDGIMDDVDACPDDDEDFDAYQDQDGCPERDNDGDGVLDTADGPADSTGFGSCRNQPEDFDGFQDTDGCPDPDNDRDGFPDAEDGPKEATGFGACNAKPEDFDGFEDEDGCPEPDNDNDEICDPWFGEQGLLDQYADVCKGLDECPSEPETFNEFKDEDGCPDIAPKAMLTDKAIQILESIYFDFNKSKIQTRSFPLLDEVVQILELNPQVNLIRVEGHTDTVGIRGYNVALSAQRAHAVVKYLVQHGIAKKRFIATGFGPDFPIDTNDTQEGRDHNRRVEFNILGIDGKQVENQIIRTKPKL